MAEGDNYLNAVEMIELVRSLPNNRARARGALYLARFGIRRSREAYEAGVSMMREFCRPNQYALIDSVIRNPVGDVGGLRQLGI
ncbi:MAG: hypothetical protein WC613_01185 [Candidatus Aenigmatarchaeota archaeon]